MARGNIRLTLAAGALAAASIHTFNNGLPFVFEVPAGPTLDELSELYTYGDDALPEGADVGYEPEWTQ